MSENIVLSREELINNFMEKFGASFENFEYRILTKIYKIKSLKEFQEFNMKTFKTVSVDQINNAIAEKDKRIVRPPQAIYIRAQQQPQSCEQGEKITKLESLVESTGKGKEKARELEETEILNGNKKRTGC
ncbi:14393_t:CDS:2 [Rhizophagus irregularis]|nr:14393_t:CDS:2 [Rhizophagus irregularis]